MERLTEEEFMFIWEPVLGPDTVWSEYCDYTLWCVPEEPEIDNPV